MPSLISSPTRLGQTFDVDSNPAQLEPWGRDNPIEMCHLGPPVTRSDRGARPSPTGPVSGDLIGGRKFFWET